MNHRITLEEAYEQTLSAIDDIQSVGIEIRSVVPKSASNPDTIKKYDKEGRLRADLWRSVSFKIKNKDDAKLLWDKRHALMSKGICFDSGAGGGEMDWEIDWSFHVLNTNDYRDIEDINERIDHSKELESIQDEHWDEIMKEDSV